MREVREYDEAVVRPLAFLTLAIAACASSPSSSPSVAPTREELPVASAAPQVAAPIASSAPKKRASDDPLLAAVGDPVLTPREREEWGTALTSLIAPCPNSAATIAECITREMACARCVPAAKVVLKMVTSGMEQTQIATAYAARFDPRAVHDIATDGSPVRGPANAPVTIVDFVDFECPACAAAAPMVDKAVAAHAEQVRLVHKFVAIAHHPHADAAARAGYAAHVQGKFWPMHDALLTNQHALEQRDLEAYAKKVGLDVPRFVRDMNSSAARARVDADVQAWRDLNAGHTPAIYVNGRLYASDAGTLEEWIGDALPSR
jgi:protein-disulfide isomerase